MGRVWLASRLAWQKLLTLDIAHKLFHQIFFTQAILIGTSDFYDSIPLSMTLTLPEDHKVSMKQNLLASFSRTLFI